MNKEKTFFMVFVEGANSPTCQHATLEQVEQEAKRLSEKTGKRAYVLVAIKSFELAKFIEQKLDISDYDLSF